MRCSSSGGGNDVQSLTHSLTHSAVDSSLHVMWYCAMCAMRCSVSLSDSGRVQRSVFDLTPATIGNHTLRISFEQLVTDPTHTSVGKMCVRVSHTMRCYLLP